MGFNALYYSALHMDPPPYPVRTPRTPPRSLEYPPVKKLKLDVEELSVDSYSVGEAQMPRGTVRGHETTTQYCGLTSLEYYLGTTWMQRQPQV